MAKQNKDGKKKRKAPLKVVITRALAIILALLMLVAVGYYAFSAFSIEEAQNYTEIL